MSEFATDLIVDGGHPAVRIEVLGADYQVHASGYGRVEERLPAGFYTVRYAAADATEERDITLRPGGSTVVEDPPMLEFASAAPLDLTWTSHEYHQEHAQRLSHISPLERGHGSHVLIFVRDVDTGMPGHLAQGLSLHRLNGEMIVHLDKVVEESTKNDQARWAGCHIALDPGTYRLRLQAELGKSVEATIVACPGWQSQMFIMRQGGSYDKAGKPFLDLSGSTQLMARPDQGFQPQSRVRRGTVRIHDANDDLRLAELVRQALALGRRAISNDDLYSLLNGTWQDPLIGILGMHLFLRQPDPDLTFATRVMERLREEILLGFAHPDAVALNLEILRRRGVAIQTAPIESLPMLRASWQMLLRASVELPSLISSGSLPDRVADRLWGAGAWLTWEEPAEVATVPTPSSHGANWFALSGAGGALLYSHINQIINKDVWRSTEGASVQTHRSPDTLESWLRTTSDVAGASDLLDFAQSLIDSPATMHEQLPSLDFTSLRGMLTRLLPEIQTLGQASAEELAEVANLDGAELAILSQLEVAQRSLLRNLQKHPSDSFAPASLVEQLGLPAERVRAAMTHLLLKLLVIREKGEAIEAAGVELADSTSKEEPSKTAKILMPIYREEVLLSPAPPYTVDALQGSLVRLLQESLRRVGMIGPLLRGELQFTLEQAFPTEEVIVIAIKAETQEALDAYQRVLLPELERWGEAIRQSQPNEME